MRRCDRGRLSEAYSWPRLIVPKGDLASRLKLEMEPNPALIEHARKRAESAQNRIADRITAFAGSMAFVYIHVVWFSCWIGLASRSTRTAS